MQPHVLPCIEKHVHAMSSSEQIAVLWAWQCKHLVVWTCSKMGSLADQGASVNQGMCAEPHTRNKEEKLTVI
eukprot:9150021-Lingulodinium_polyedra.AAC.1